MLLLFLAAVPCFANDCGSGWGYTGTTGPTFWGGLRPEWLICSTGAAQSPINVTWNAPATNTLPLLTVSHAVESTFKVENTGHDLKVKEFSAPWTLEWYGRHATLEQFHFHVKAEHFDNGTQHLGEIHFLFKDNRNGSNIVLVVWIKSIAGANPGLTKILPSRPASCVTSLRSTTTVKLDDFLVNVNRNRYATYEGSLTTPPCSEDVSFIILRDGITVTQSQLNALTIVPLTVGGNVRPGQRQGVRWRQ